MSRYDEWADLERPAHRDLVDERFEDFIADLDGQAIPWLAHAFYSTTRYRRLSGPPAFLRRMQHLTASKRGRGRDDLVSSQQGKSDPKPEKERDLHPGGFGDA